jgi:hypothetical protein
MNEYIKNKIETSYFNTISVLFLFIFIFYVFRKGIKQGFELTLFLWCLTVCTTPISSASILLSFPIKIFTKIPMFVTKFVTSILSLGLLVYYYKYNYSLINKIPLGKAFIKIIKSNLYVLFIVSIVASTLSSYMIDNFVDYFILSDMKMIKKDKLGSLLAAFLIFVFLNYIYFNILIKYKIFTSNRPYYFL